MAFLRSFQQWLCSNVNQNDICSENKVTIERQRYPAPNREHDDDALESNQQDEDRSHSFETAASSSASASGGGNYLFQQRNNSSIQDQQDQHQRAPPPSSWDSLGPRDKLKLKTSLQQIVEKFVDEMRKGKVFMKIGRNGRMFYRWCYVDDSRKNFLMNIKGQMVEYPFADILHVHFGLDTSDFFQDPVPMPSEKLSAVLVLRDNRRLNLVFSNQEERDEFVSSMLVLVGEEGGVGD